MRIATDRPRALATRTPIALAEQIRILASARRYAEVASLADKFHARYNNHDLAQSVRDLACEAEPSRCPATRGPGDLLLPARGAGEQEQGDEQTIAPRPPETSE